MNASSLLTISILTIPERREYLGRLLESIVALGQQPTPHINVIYNCRAERPLREIESEIQSLASTAPIDVYFNAADPTIVSGRNLQLSVCRTPLIAFVDDDVTMHGDVVGGILDTLAAHPVALLGFRSVNAETNQPVKPRETTPSVDLHGLRFMPVQGMLCAGYRALLSDVGGFNTRRRYWGEWTELNLRLWRCGFPTAYRLDRGYLRHWENAPASPTRSMNGRERHVVWGLMCTALEYDAVDVNEATAVFWRLVEERYLAYSYGHELSPINVLKTVLELVPRISDEWGSIQEFRRTTETHPFKFAPFHAFTPSDVEAVYASAQTHMRRIRDSVSTVADLTRTDRVDAVSRPSLRAALARLRESVRQLGRSLKRSR